MPEFRKRTGLAASSRAGAWEVDIDCTLSGPEEWFVQLQTPWLYIYFQIDGRETLTRMLGFLRRTDDVQKSCDALALETGSDDSDQLLFGKFGSMPVRIRRDEESVDRYFLSIENSSEAFLEWTIKDDNLHTLITVLETLIQDLEGNSGGSE